MMNDLLEIRKRLKEKKPIFIRQDTQKRKKLALKWRKPKGLHSKIRHQFRGKMKLPSPGYKSPLKVKGMHSSGLKIVRVFSADDVKKISKAGEGIVVSKAVGMKKRLEILKKAKELEVEVLNFNADERIKKIEDFIASKKKTAAKEIKKEPAEKKEGKKDGGQDAQKDGAMTEEQKKESDKKEKDRVLTKKK